MNEAPELGNIMVMAAMAGWPFVTLLIFFRMPPRRAAIVSFLAGWMFLPDVVYKVPGIPGYSKTMATSLSVLVGVMLFDLKSLTSLRPGWRDIPILVYCLCPFASSMANKLGVYNGVSSVFYECISWGVPYVIGRAQLRSMEAFRELAGLLFVAGLIYVPFCAYEIRMSPQLNRMVYGFGIAGGGEYAKELGMLGSRPRVFMGSGLAVGTFLTAASLMGVWLWYTGSIKRVWGLAVRPLVGGLIITTFLCKNMGALALLMLGLAALFTTRSFARGLLVCLLIAAAPLYMITRASGRWSADSMVQMAAAVHPQRGQSLAYRLANEDMLAAKALQRPIFGWGGFGRSRVYREDGKDLSTTDGLWMISLGTNGVVGLSSVTTVLLMPAVLFARRYPFRYWSDPRLAGAAACVVLVVLYMIDNLLNSMFNPVFVMAAAGLLTVTGLKAAAAAPARAMPAEPVPVRITA